MPYSNNSNSNSNNPTTPEEEETRLLLESSTAIRDNHFGSRITNSQASSSSTKMTTKDPTISVPLGDGSKTTATSVPLEQPSNNLMTKNSNTTETTRTAASLAYSSTRSNSNNNNTGASTRQSNSNSSYFPPPSFHDSPSVAQLKLSEKLSLLSGKSLWLLPSLKRFRREVPSIRLSDGPHGVRKPVKDLSLQQSFPATCFPTAAALACSWDPTLIRKVGKALRHECVHYDVSVLLGPGMNLKRHPCGGRNFEYFSEDPYLTGELAAAYIHGVQGSGQVAACAKHFAVNNQESHRFVVNATVDERTLRELYLRQFERVIKDKTSPPLSVMCAYNKVNGQYCSEQEYLNVQILRQEWGYDGVLMSDWGAVNDRVAGLRAQLDLEMPGSHGVHNREIRRALHNGTLTEAEIDTSAQRVLNLIERVRVPDKTSKKNDPTTSNGSNSTRSKRTSGTAPLDEDVSGSSGPQFTSSSISRLSWPVQHDIAKKTALECAVLLRNEDNFLPLQANSVHSIAVIGEFGRSFPRYQGMGSSHVQSEWVRAAYDEVFRFCDNVSFAPGYEEDDEDMEQVNGELLQEAIDVAREAQVVLLCVGLPEIMESEGFDREHLQLPAQHNALVTEICKVNPNVIVVLSNGGVVEMPWVDKPKAIFESYLLGEAGSAAIVDLVFGTQSPSGKLSESFPLQLSDIPADQCFPGTRDRVEHREGLDVGYRYFDSADQPVLFPFGHGLTYTTFSYGQVEVEVLSDESQSKRVKVSMDLTNTGKFPAKEVVQCYVRDIQATVFRPFQELRAFDKMFLHPGETTKVEFQLEFEAFAFYDVGATDWIVEPGEFEIRIGSSSRDIRQSKILELATGQYASAEAQQSYPPRAMGTQPPLDDDNFSRRFHGALDSINRCITPLHNNFHRNSLLKEVATSSSLGKFLLWVVFKGATSDIRPGPSWKRDRKLMEAAVRNLPLRTMVLFGNGALSFELMDALISLMNGFYSRAVSGFLVASTPFRRKAREPSPEEVVYESVSVEPYDRSVAHA